MTPRCLAKKHMVNVIQFSQGKYDEIQPIYFGDFLTDLKPTVYYEVTEFGVVYCFFHRKDWTKCKNFLVRKLDSHELDFEGVFKRIVNGEVIWTCTRFHHELKFIDSDTDWVHIQSQGHGIRPGYPKRLKEKFIEYKKDDFSFVNMDTFRVRKIVNNMVDISPVTHWESWNDYRIERKFGKRTTGLLRTEPARMFDLAKKCKLVKDLT